jgi:hypothetical protein
MLTQHWGGPKVLDGHRSCISKLMKPVGDGLMIRDTGADIVLEDSPEFWSSVVSVIVG